MLRVGLTGGIGSGKSTVARRLVERGAVLVDSDVLAREVVAPGTEGLAEVVAAFGTGVLDADGAVNRPALAAVVFGDRAARERLNAIVHPRVRRRSAEQIDSAAADAIVVQDVPLLVENGMAPGFPLVVVVHATPEERVERLVRRRGMTEPDARARVVAQADDAARRAAADVWLDNGGAPAELDRAVDELFRGRLVPFEENLRRRRPAAGSPIPVRADARWAADAARLTARVAAAAGDRSRGVDHVGPTAVPGTATADVVDLQLAVIGDPADEALRDALRAVGFPWCSAGDGQLHGSADPGRPARLHVREQHSPGWRNALLLRDWSRTDPGRSPSSAGRGHAPPPEAEAWAAATGWVPPVG